MTTLILVRNLAHVFVFACMLILVVLILPVAFEAWEEIRNAQVAAEKAVQAEEQTYGDLRIHTPYTDPRATDSTSGCGEGEEFHSGFKATHDGSDAVAGVVCKTPNGEFVGYVLRGN